MIKMKKKMRRNTKFQKRQTRWSSLSKNSLL